jgi:MFS family permease
VSQFWTSRIVSPAFQYPIDGLTPEQAQFFSIRPIVGTGFANLVGTAFVIPLIIASIFSGIVAANFNRAVVMCGGVIIWSGAIVASGFANNLFTLIGLRVVLGLT